LVGISNEGQFWRVEVMKTAVIFLSMLISTAAIAQSSIERQAQAVMQQIQQMQACMERVDQAKMEALEQRQNQFEQEVQVLCASGKRDAAHRKALQFETEMAANPIVKAVEKCELMAQELMGEKLYEEESAQHICDSEF